MQLCSWKFKDTELHVCNFVLCMILGLVSIGSCCGLIL